MLAIDTNVLVYAEGLGDLRRVSMAERLLQALFGSKPLIPVQVLGELFHVLVRKGRLSADQAAVRIERFRAVASPLPSSSSTLSLALELAREHHFQVFDAIILAASAEAGCRMLLSEDMQDGFVWRGVTIVNPFADAPHPLFADLLANGAPSRPDRPA